MPESADSITNDFFPLADQQINGSSSRKQEDRVTLEAEVRPAELALTEEHTSCVNGMYHKCF